MHAVTASAYTDAALVAMATRLSIDGNPVPHGHEDWTPERVLHVERDGVGSDWRITLGGLVRDRRAGCWREANEYGFDAFRREAEPYHFAVRDDALRQAEQLAAELRAGTDPYRNLGES